MPYMFAFPAIWYHWMFWLTRVCDNNWHTWYHVHGVSCQCFAQCGWMLALYFCWDICGYVYPLFLPCLASTGCFYFGVDTAALVFIAQAIEWIQLAVILRICLLFLKEHRDGFVRATPDNENVYDCNFSHSVCLATNEMLMRHRPKSSHANFHNHNSWRCMRPPKTKTWMIPANDAKYQIPANDAKYQF